MMMVALMMTATMSFAQGVKESKGMTMDQLSKYLRLDADQYEEVADIKAYFEKQLGAPMSAESITRNARPVEAQNALLCNLKLMKKVLTKEQYNRYVSLVNVTLANQEDKAASNLVNAYLANK